MANSTLPSTSAHAEATAFPLADLRRCNMQGIATTPFLAGLDRTLPQLTPGISPEALAMFQAALPPGALVAAAKADKYQPAAPAQPDEAPALPERVQQSSPSAADLAQNGFNAASSVEEKKTGGAAAEDGAWEGLVDLSPMPGNFTHPTNMAFLESPDMDALSTLCQVSPLTGSANRPTPVLFKGAVQLDTRQQVLEPSAESALGSASRAAQKDSPAAVGMHLGAASVQDEESVGSASPADVAAMACRSDTAPASDTGASAVRGQPAAAQVTFPAVPLRL